MRRLPFSNWFSRPSGPKFLGEPSADYARPSLTDHLSPGGPKRILALDGGGIRGALAVGVLERVEQLLRERHGNNPEFCVSDYYDLIGGTSTGSIIAAGCAALRYSASDIKDLFFDLGPKVFKGSIWRQGLLRAKFDGKRLLEILDSLLGDMTLGDPRMATGFAIVSKRVDTASTWVLFNHPDGKFFNDSPGNWIGNKHYPIKNIVRASTAAPYYFQPEKIEIVKGKEWGLFMDGGVTPHNNPAFQLVMLAGLSGYSFNWKLSPNDLLVTSIGTGSMAEKLSANQFDARPQVSKTLSALTSMITGAEDFVELLMQWVSDAPDPKHIDAEVERLDADYLAGGPLLSYQRYQCFLTKQKLKDELGLSLTDGQINTVRDMTNPDGLKISYEIGLALADQVAERHFPETFDVPVLKGAPSGLIA